MTRDPRKWGGLEQGLLEKLVELVGAPSGEGGRSREAYRQAARLLADRGVEPDRVETLVLDYALQNLRGTGPMPLVAVAAGEPAREAGLVVIQRWPKLCVSCSREVRRGELASIRRGTSGWLVSCGDCEPVPHDSQRAEQGRRRAVETDDDPEDLLLRLLEHTPPEHREAVSDDLAAVVAIREDS